MSSLDDVSEVSYSLSEVSTCITTRLSLRGGFALGDGSNALAFDLAR
jgi:hypothetical protein